MASALAALALIAPYEISFRTCGITHGVPSWLLKGMAARTSGFDPTAHGPTNDWGLMQVIEANAPGCGISISDLTNPHKNICCGAWLMHRNLSRVRELGARGSDAIKISLYRNNMGGGNTDHILRDLAPPKTWERFKIATSAYPNKHVWIEKLWESAQTYRRGEWILLGSVTTFIAAVSFGIWRIIRS